MYRLYNRFYMITLDLLTSENSISFIIRDSYHFYTLRVVQNLDMIYHMSLYIIYVYIFIIDARLHLIGTVHSTYITFSA